MAVSAIGASSRFRSLEAKMSKYRADDLDLLLPSFRKRIDIVIERLRERGYQPVPRDTLRTSAEAAKNAETGVGVANSMHCYGAACDVICDVHGWDCRKHGCQFFAALGEEAEKLGLTWGGRWSRRGRGPDMPHVQGVRVIDQTRFRRLKDAEARDAFIAERLSPLDD